MSSQQGLADMTRVCDERRTLASERADGARAAKSLVDDSLEIWSTIRGERCARVTQPGRASELLTRGRLDKIVVGDVACRAEGCDNLVAQLNLNGRILREVANDLDGRRSRSIRQTKRRRGNDKDRPSSSSRRSSPRPVKHPNQSRHERRWKGETEATHGQQKG